MSQIDYHNIEAILETPYNMGNVRILHSMECNTSGAINHYGFLVFVAWLYDETKYYPGSMFLGLGFIILSCIVMVYPWYFLKCGCLKNSPSCDMDMNEMELKTNDSILALKKQVFNSMESLHSTVPASVDSN